LVISRDDLDWALDRLAETLREVEHQAPDRSPAPSARAGSPQVA
jgi:hypothetical protein